VHKRRNTRNNSPPVPYSIPHPKQHKTKPRKPNQTNKKTIEESQPDPLATCSESTNTSRSGSRRKPQRILTRTRKLPAKGGARKIRRPPLGGQRRVRLRDVRGNSRHKALEKARQKALEMFQEIPRRMLGRMPRKVFGRMPGKMLGSMS